MAEQKKTARDYVRRYSGPYEDGNGKIHNIQAGILLDLSGGIPLEDLVEVAIELDAKEPIRMIRKGDLKTV